MGPRRVNAGSPGRQGPTGLRDTLNLEYTRAKTLVASSPPTVQRVKFFVWS